MTLRQLIESTKNLSPEMLDEEIIIEITLPDETSAFTTADELMVAAQNQYIGPDGVIAEEHYQELEDEDKTAYDRFIDKNQFVVRGKPLIAAKESQYGVPHLTIVRE